MSGFYSQFYGNFCSMHSCVCLFVCGRALCSPGWPWALYLAVSTSGVLGLLSHGTILIVHTFFVYMYSMTVSKNYTCFLTQVSLVGCKGDCSYIQLEIFILWAFCGCWCSLYFEIMCHYIAQTSLDLKFSFYNFSGSRITGLYYHTELKIVKLYFMCRSVCPCICVYHVYSQCLQRSEEGVMSSGTEV